MELFTRLIARPEDRKKQFARWRLVGLFILSGTALVCLIGPRFQNTGALFPWSPQLAVQSSLSGHGQGAGGTGGIAANAHVPAEPAFCLPTDTTCIINDVASGAASQIQKALQPIADEILSDPADIIYQTPLLTDDTSPQNKAIIALNSFFVEVVDLAFACLLIIAGYNAIVGRHLNLLHTSILEALPRAVLVVMAVHFNLLFVGLFIRFENALTLGVVHVTGFNTLTNLITGMFTSPAPGLIAFILLVVLGVMVMLLLVQMITRIALVAIGLAFTPLGLGCFLLPQTMRWGRLWLVTLSSSVLVQFVQVTALCLGGVFISALSATSFVRIDKELALIFLSIGTIGLVLKIPGMLQTWALHPMMDIGGKGGASGPDGGTGASDSFAGGSTATADTAAGGGSSAAMEGTIVTEESGTLLLLF